MCRAVRDEKSPDPQVTKRSKERRVEGKSQGIVQFASRAKRGGGKSRPTWKSAPSLQRSQGAGKMPRRFLSLEGPSSL